MSLGPCQRPECGHPVDDHRVMGHTTKHFGSCPFCPCPIAVFGTTKEGVVDHVSRDH